jgi:hypothetical protein
MKKLLVVLMPCISFFSVMSQSAVILQHNGSNTSFYSNAAFQNAYAAAVSGDTIYLPGGYFPPPPDIDKKLAIIGVGHNPDSTIDNKPTVISGNITLFENADGCFIAGMKVEGYVRVPGGVGVDNLSISRLYITDRLLIEPGKWSVIGSVRECIIIGEINGAGMDQFSITNSIFGHRFYYAKNSIVSNNVFLGGDPIGSGVRVLYYLDNCLIRNNIFYNAVFDWQGLVSSQMQNNVFANEPAMNGNFSSANFFNVNMTNVFVSYNNTGFAYTHNFRLNTPASYVGTDATQVGLYGTLKPWKTGSIPANPHIQTKTIAENTDADGKIQVQIKVSAQNN